jgi:hypothetical protein
MATVESSDEQQKLEKQIRLGSSWLTWISGLTVVNTVMAFQGMKMVLALPLVLPIGIAMTEHDRHKGIKGAIITAIFTIFCVSIFFILGYFAKRGARWAFIAGIVFYILDTVIWLTMKNPFVIFFHIFAIWRIAAALTPVKQLSELKNSVFQSQGLVWPPAPQVYPEEKPAPHP